MELRKYPRTPHLEGSRLQPGDEDLAAVPFVAIAGQHLVVEEKVDGANSAVSFSADGAMHLQSRGHFLTGGYRERHFAPLKAWASTVREELWVALRDRYVMYGEWCYAKHTVYYDQLPHYFLEFDILDRQSDSFLATPARATILRETGVKSVPVLHAGGLARIEELTAMVGVSRFKSPNWRTRLRDEAAGLGLDQDRASAETDPTDLMEGLYIKVEREGRVMERYKWVRVGFLQAVAQSDSHWLDRPIIPNALAPGAGLFPGGGA
ncbi:MAG: RNA ligase family protein [bacterium]|nr:RNA ligase family protein [bacterium]